MHGADKSDSGHIHTFTSNPMVLIFISQSDSLICLFFLLVNASLSVYVVELSPFHIKKKPYSAQTIKIQQYLISLDCFCNSKSFKVSFVDAYAT